VKQAEVHGEPRFAMLETIREYAGDRLLAVGEVERVRERHRDYFLALAEEAEPKLKGAEQAEWLRRLEGEHENLRASLDWSLAEAGSEGGLRLCGALARFWFTRGHLSEGREWCVRALSKAGGDERTPARAKALNAAGALAHFQGDYPAAQARFEESLAIRRELADRSGIARSLNGLANVAHEQGDFASARTLHEECLAIMRELEDRWGIARSLAGLGNVTHEQRDFASAQALYEESLAIWRELGERRAIAHSLNNLGNVASVQGVYSAARALYAESLATSVELGESRAIAHSLEGLADVNAALGSSLRAVRIWGAAGRLREEIGSPLRPNKRPGYDRRMAASRAALGDDAAFDRAWQEGRALPLEQAIKLALEDTVERG
jgi:tetratricopeptide (TPR) repeat protein